MPPTGSARPTAPPTIRGYQAGTIGGEACYVRISGSHVYYYTLTDGRLQRISTPEVATAGGESLRPVRTGSAVWFPQELEGGEIIWTRWNGSRLETYAGDPRQSQQE